MKKIKKAQKLTLEKSNSNLLTIPKLSNSNSFSSQISVFSRAEENSFDPENMTGSTSKRLLDISGYTKFSQFTKNYSRWRDLAPKVTKDSDDDLNYFLLTVAQNEKWGRCADRLNELHADKKTEALITEMQKELEPTQLESHNLLFEMFKARQGSDNLDSLEEFYNQMDSVRQNTLLKNVPESIFASAFAANCKYPVEVSLKMTKESTLHSLYLEARKIATANGNVSSSINRVQSSFKKPTIQCGYCRKTGHTEDKCFKKQKNEKYKRGKFQKNGYKRENRGEIREIKTILGDLNARLAKIDISSDNEDSNE